VATGADDVDRRAVHLEAVGVLEHHRGQTGHLRDGLALAAQGGEEGGQLGRGGLAGHDAVHDPGGVAAGEVLAAHERREEVRPAGVVLVAGGGKAGAGHRRASSATVSASRCGSRGRGTAASASDQVASQPSTGRPVSTRTGGHRNISFLSWREAPMPPEGWDSPSRLRTTQATVLASSTAISGVATSVQWPITTSSAGVSPTPRRTASRTDRSLL